MKRRNGDCVWIGKGNYLCMTTNASCEDTEGDSLLLLQHVLQVHNCVAQSHALNGSTNLTAMFKMDALVGNAGLAGCYE